MIFVAEPEQTLLNLDPIGLLNRPCKTYVKLWSKLMDRIVSFGEALVDMLSSRLDGQSSDSTETFSKFPGGAPANVAAAVGKLGGARRIMKESDG